MNAFDIIEREIAQELVRHGLWVGGRKCACGGWAYKINRGQARATYAAMLEAHHHHVSKVITRRLLDCGGLPMKEFLAQKGISPTGALTTTTTTCDPTLLSDALPAGERFA